MSCHGSKLGYKQEHAIAALLTKRNVEEAARAADISVKTLLRWLKTSEFVGAYRAARREAFSQCIVRLQHGATAATSTLLKIMLNDNAPPACRVRAADTVLSHASKAIEIEDVEARVAELERITGAEDDGN